MATCPILCDSDCESRCHEEHQVRWKREHEPKDCPGWCQHWDIDTLPNNVGVCRNCGDEFTYIPVAPETSERLRKAFGLDLPRIKVNWPTD